MTDIPSKPLRPFEAGQYLTSFDLDRLHNWLQENCEQSILLTADYKVSDLVDDLGKILDSMWNER